MQIIGNYPSILALEAGQALEKSRCFGRTGRAEGKNQGKQTMFEPTRFSGPLGPAPLGGEFGLFRWFFVSRASRASAALLFAYFLVSKSRKWAWLTKMNHIHRLSLRLKNKNCRVERRRRLFFKIMTPNKRGKV
jgi:hypothetical protein